MAKHKRCSTVQILRDAASDRELVLEENSATGSSFTYSPLTDAVPSLKLQSGEKKLPHAGSLHFTSCIVSACLCGFFLTQVTQISVGVN